MFENFLSLMKKRTALFGLMVSFSYLPSPEELIRETNNKRKQRTTIPDAVLYMLSSFSIFFLTWEDSLLLEPHKNSTTKVIEFM